jgi:hypothetical protein
MCSSSTLTASPNSKVAFTLLSPDNFDVLVVAICKRFGSNREKYQQSGIYNFSTVCGCQALDAIISLPIQGPIGAVAVDDHVVVIVLGLLRLFLCPFSFFIASAFTFHYYPLFLLQQLKKGSIRTVQNKK